SPVGQDRVCEALDRLQSAVLVQDEDYGRRSVRCQAGDEFGSRGRLQLVSKYLNLASQRSFAAEFVTQPVDQHYLDGVVVHTRSYDVPAVCVTHRARKNHLTLAAND